MNPTVEEAKDAHRDAAALLLALLRNDVDTIQAINATTNALNLLSGTIAVSGAILLKLSGSIENAQMVMTQIIQMYTDMSDEDWAKICNSAITIGAN